MVKGFGFRAGESENEGRGRGRGSLSNGGNEGEGWVRPIKTGCGGVAWETNEGREQGGLSAGSRTG